MFGKNHSSKGKQSKEDKPAQQSRQQAPKDDAADSGISNQSKRVDKPARSTVAAPVSSRTENKPSRDTEHHNAPSTSGSGNQQGTKKVAASSDISRTSNDATRSAATAAAAQISRPAEKHATREREHRQANPASQSSKASKPVPSGEGSQMSGPRVQNPVQGLEPYVQSQLGPSAVQQTSEPQLTQKQRQQLAERKQTQLAEESMQYARKLRQRFEWDVDMRPEKVNMGDAGEIWPPPPAESDIALQSDRRKCFSQALDEDGKLWKRYANVQKDSQDQRVSAHDDSRARQLEGAVSMSDLMQIGSKGIWINANDPMSKRSRKVSSLSHFVATHESRVRDTGLIPLTCVVGFLLPENKPKKTEDVEIGSVSDVLCLLTNQLLRAHKGPLKLPYINEETLRAVKDREVAPICRLFRNLVIEIARVPLHNARASRGFAVIIDGVNNLPANRALKSLILTLRCLVSEANQQEWPANVSFKFYLVDGTVCKESWEPSPELMITMPKPNSSKAPAGIDKVLISSRSPSPNRNDVKPGDFYLVPESKGGTFTITGDGTFWLGTYGLQTCVGVYFSIDAHRAFCAHINAYADDDTNLGGISESDGKALRKCIYSALSEEATISKWETDKWDIPALIKSVLISCPHKMKDVGYDSEPAVGLWVIAGIKDFLKGVVADRQVLEINVWDEMGFVVNHTTGEFKLLSESATTYLYEPPKNLPDFEGPTQMILPRFQWAFMKGSEF